MPLVYLLACNYTPNLILAVCRPGKINPTLCISSLRSSPMKGGAEISAENSDLYLRRRQITRPRVTRPTAQAMMFCTCYASLLNRRIQGAIPSHIGALKGMRQVATKLLTCHKDPGRLHSTATGRQIIKVDRSSELERITGHSCFAQT